MAKVIKISILLFWLVMLGFLVERTYLRPASVVALDVITEEGVRAGEEWFGIYQHGRKIGYSHSIISLEGDTYHIFEESELDLLVLERVQRVKTVINSYAARNFLLKYFDFSLQSGQTGMRLKGAVVKKQLVLDIETGGRTTKENILLKEPPYLPLNVKPALILMGLETGRRYRFSVFNPASLSTEEASVFVEAKESIKIGEEEKTVYKLKETFQGLDAFSWMTQDGETIREESPLGYVLRRETREEAMKRDKEGPSVDIIDLTRIPSDPIDNAGRTTYLRVRLKDAPLDGFDLDGGRQARNGDVLEIRTEAGTKTYLLPSRENGLSEYLAATALIQSDDREIRGQAEKIVGGEKNAREAATKLNDWVYNTLYKKPVVSIPNAVEVLKQRTGDCNEHTTLYTALARAAGLPTRMAAGIVYMSKGFYYHAWPEVWLGSWVAVDPTLNQFPADATHIRFIIGDLGRQSEILKLVGKLKVEVLEYR
jgi:transglutaminase-like putative cysteine protease